MRVACETVSRNPGISRNSARTRLTSVRKSIRRSQLLAYMYLLARGEPLTAWISIRRLCEEILRNPPDLKPRGSFDRNIFDCQPSRTDNSAARLPNGGDCLLRSQVREPQRCMFPGP